MVGLRLIALLATGHTTEQAAIAVSRVAIRFLNALVSAQSPTTAQEMWVASNATSTELAFANVAMNGTGRIAAFVQIISTSIGIA